MIGGAMQWRNEVARDDGAAALIVAVVIAFALFGVAATVADGGALYATKRTLQTTADAAALAGAQELPSDTAAARSSATYYLTQNTREPLVGTPQIDILSTYSANDTIRVTLVADAPAAFSQVWGRTGSPIKASAAAVVTSPSGYGAGVMPLGVMSSEPSGSSPFGYVFNEQVTLKRAQGESGNFQLLSLTDPPLGHDGANDVKSALRTGGVDNPVYLNTLYNTKAGEISGVTAALRQWIGADAHSFEEVATMREDGTVAILDKACPRLIICPIVVDPGPPVVYNWDGFNGTSKPVLIIGFSYFYVESIGGTGNDCWIIGRFIRPVGPEDAMTWGPVDPYGAIGFKLVQ